MTYQKTMEGKPLVTFTLFAYNQERFIQEAVDAAFSQIYSPLEIILSDDCSQDATFEIMREAVRKYSGPHSVIINRTVKNKGLAEHINSVFPLVNGDFIVMAAGDDISLPERTELLVNRWLDEEHPVDLVCSYFEEIDINGKKTEFIEKHGFFFPDIKMPIKKWRCGATGACAAFDRKLYDKYGCLDKNVISEDHVFPFRAWLENGLDCLQLPLVQHRTHESSLYFIHANIKKQKDRFKRKEIRQMSAMNALGIYSEWIKAWAIKNGYDNDVCKKLICLKNEKEIECLAFQASFSETIKLAFLAFMTNFNIRTLLRILFRYALNRH